MKVRDMLSAMYRRPTKETVEKYVCQSLRNATKIAFKNATHFSSAEDCINDATRQFKVLKDAINDDDNKLALFNINVSAVEAFKEICKEDFTKLQKLYDSTK